MMFGIVGRILFMPSKLYVALAASGGMIMQAHAQSVPKLQVGGRVMDLANGEQFDDVLRDTPDQLRPPAIVAFWGHKTCKASFDKLEFDKNIEDNLPSRERLFAAKYDVDSASHPDRLLNLKFTPERDLAKRFGVTDLSTRCPQLVFVPRKCNGRTTWCEDGGPDENGVTKVGCDDFVEQCTDVEHWGGDGDWKAWLSGKIREQGPPRVSKTFGSYTKQQQWLRSRDVTTNDNTLRNIFLAHDLPWYSDIGYKVVNTPKPLQDWLMNFWESRGDEVRQVSDWEMSSTQTNFHEVQMMQVSMDRHDRTEKARIADDYIKPLLEAWVGFELEQTSWYGIREYYPGAELRPHIDRIDTHVISATINVAKLVNPNNASEVARGLGDYSWPLEVIDKNGQNVKHNHEVGQMILYESSVLTHGRPTTLQDGIHLGAFCHYKPTGKQRKQWESAVRAADGKHARRTNYVTYRSTEVQEPADEKYVWSDYPVGKGAGDDISRVLGLDAHEDSFSFTLHNNEEFEIELYWVSHRGSSVPNGSVKKGAKLTIHTFEGHKFFVAKKGDQKRVPLYHMFAHPDQRVVNFRVKSNYKIPAAFRGLVDDAQVHDEL